MRVKYIGAREYKRDNVAGTGTVWGKGEVKEVPDDAAVKLIRVSSLWTEAGPEDGADPTGGGNSPGGADSNGDKPGGKSTVGKPK